MPARGFWEHAPRCEHRRERVAPEPILVPRIGGEPDLAPTLKFLLLVMHLYSTFALLCFSIGFTPSAVEALLRRCAWSGGCRCTSWSTSARRARPCSAPSGAGARLRCAGSAAQQRRCLHSTALQLLTASSSGAGRRSAHGRGAAGAPALRAQGLPLRRVPAAARGPCQLPQPSADVVMV